MTLHDWQRPVTELYEETHMDLGEFIDLGGGYFRALPEGHHCPNIVLYAVPVSRPILDPDEIYCERPELREGVVRRLAASRCAGPFAPQPTPEFVKLVHNTIRRADPEDVAKSV